MIFAEYISVTVVLSGANFSFWLWSDFQFLFIAFHYYQYRQPTHTLFIYLLRRLHNVYFSFSAVTFHAPDFTLSIIGLLLPQYTRDRLTILLYQFHFTTTAMLIDIHIGRAKSSHIELFVVAVFLCLDFFTFLPSYIHSPFNVEFMFPLAPDYIFYHFDDIISQQYFILKLN